MSRTKLVEWLEDVDNSNESHLNHVFKRTWHKDEHLAHGSALRAFDMCDSRWGATTQMRLTRPVAAKKNNTVTHLVRLTEVANFFDGLNLF